MTTEQQTHHTEFAEFSAHELETLRRVDATPSTRDGGYLNDQPITPAGPIVPVEELLQRPDLDTGTAAEWSTWFLAHSWAHRNAALQDMPRPAREARGGDRPAPARAASGDMLSYLVHHNQFADTYLIGHLLRHVPDDVAREVMTYLDDGDAANEALHAWLAEAGVKSERIRSAESIALVQARIDSTGAPA